MSDTVVHSHVDKLIEPKNKDTIREVLDDFIGQPLAVLAARFQYRGILTSVGNDHIILSKARAVEASGACSAEKPTNEDNMGCSAVIAIGAIELFHQCNWVFAPLD